MDKEKSFLPTTLRDFFKTLVIKCVGVFFIVLGFVLLFKLFFYNSYLDGFAVASSFGNQGFFSNLIAILRYGIGFIPLLILFLFVIKSGLFFLGNYENDFSVEYNLLRVFVAICFGTAGFGLIAPTTTYGGLFGVIVANDLSVLGEIVCFFIGVLFVFICCVQSAELLHIKWEHIKIGFQWFVKFIMWLQSGFRLVGGNMNNLRVVEQKENDKKDEVLQKKDKVIKVKQDKENIVIKRIQKSESGYMLPDPKFLEKSVFGKNIITNELKTTAEALEIHFAEYKVLGKVAGIQPGPIVTLYKFKPDVGIRIADISATVRDMTRAMAAQSIRISPLQGTEYIAVEMGNAISQLVRFQTLVSDKLFTDSKYKIPLILGVNIGGDIVCVDLAKMPHVLIAGRTGSGKSVFVQSLIISILYHFTPDKCKLLIIDPKGVDFTLWHDIPHLVTPIVTDANEAVNALKWSVREMEERYKQLKFFGVQNIEGYNEVMAEKRAKGEKVTRQVCVGIDEETGEQEFETQNVDLSDMPYLVVVIDEVADLMSVARKDVEACVQRLAQKARAAGIHLVAATQRPDATVITGVIKANFPTRISFQARSAIDSVTCLGERGAEQLLSRGDMLFSEAGKALIRVHGALIENTEINRIADFLREQGEPKYINSLTVDLNDDNLDVNKDSINSLSLKENDLYKQAIDIVRRDKRISISYLQRRLQIGYNKAASLMEKMEQDGIVSEPDTNNKRHLL